MEWLENLMPGTPASSTGRPTTGTHLTLIWIVGIKCMRATPTKFPITTITRRYHSS
ncbi:MAG: hypothetical protein UX47_C0008G0006 [Candidatus Collierbacteria bacterium GW2011_GWA2_46_26]|uniref:Uncharacterized protein n=1 Tax=Candidatus Collierbacteria bacterium GW2011_GWA2_46_26 TaxID=1618381 RepID=A0A0G1PIN3_9BACT|nr:MAG: hypothetical protein UX47_C0008G0006 [Candidatus Collierbacteria bacterium GW2011_GWA2_46_26]